MEPKREKVNRQSKNTVRRKPEEKIKAILNRDVSYTGFHLRGQD
jgi:hypothetical protein